jgi:hypothetical protein
LVTGLPAVCLSLYGRFLNNFEIHHYIRIRLLSLNFAMFTKERDASTAKRCVHSVLPLGPRAKQPDPHVHAKCTLQGVTAALSHCLHGAVELTRFVLAAGGGERSGPNMLWLLFSFMLGLREGWGGTLHRLNVSETATHVTGHCVSQECQMRISNFAFLEPCAWNLL